MKTGGLMTDLQASESELLVDFMAKPGGDVFSLIEKLGIELVRDTSLGSKSGLIEYDDGAFKISVNAWENPRRQKFTAAHEVAHYVLHRDLLKKNGHLNRHTDTLFGDPSENVSAPFNDTHEVQANRYAARLLMPARLVRQYFKAEAGNVDRLSDVFEVSKAAMKIRLKTLGLVS